MAPISALEDDQARHRNGEIDVTDICCAPVAPGATCPVTWRFWKPPF